MIDNGELVGYAGLFTSWGPMLVAIGSKDIFADSQYKKYSQELMLEEMTTDDQRDLLIHYKTRARIYDINLVFLMVLTIIAVVDRLHDWMKFLLLGVIVLNRFLYLIISNKYKKDL